jgi:hypothetical protein
LQWKWGKVLKIVPGIALIGGLLCGLIGKSIDMLLAGLAVGMFIGLLLLGFIGLNREILETKTSPNQGIHLSARNAIRAGLIVGLITGLLMGLISGLLSEGGVVDGLIVTLYVGLLFGLPSTLLYGGGYVIAHYSLRLILIIQGHIPRNYAHFLDYAVDRIFLQKVGGGYRFIHRLLLEHFAEMYEPEKKV